jgi:hypothetical protein
MTQKIFNDCLNKTTKTERPGAGVLAYYFGIIETTSDCDTYLVGSKELMKMTTTGLQHRLCSSGEVSETWTSRARLGANS